MPVLFCWMPSVPPPSGPVSDPPVIVWLKLPTDGATMIVPSMPSVLPPATVTVVDPRRGVAQAAELNVPSGCPPCR